jgi:hypothetical protein
MPVQLSYIRDQVTIGPEFLSDLQGEIQASNLAPGSTLLIAARTIKHTSGYVFALKGYNLLLTTDHYDAVDGTLDAGGVDGAVGPAGPPGNPGENGVESRDGDILNPGKPGGPGGPGGPGLNGTHGNNVTLYCRQRGGLRIVVSGGSGGAGGAGGTGGAGGDGRPRQLNRPWPFGTEGGSGGPGGAGGSGGNAGQIAVVEVPGGAATAPDLKAFGGNAGPGGAGGQIGRPGAFLDPGGHPQPVVGANGAAGARGNDVAPTWRVVTDDEYWAELRTQLGPQAEAWARYRLKVGEYYFRTFRPGIADLADRLDLAAGEFRAVLKLLPNEPRALLRLRQISLNQNILGLARDYDLVPNFPVYEKVVNDYRDSVLGIFELTITILEAAQDVAGNRNRLNDQVKHVERSLGILTKEKDAADLDSQSAQSDLNLADQRIAANNAAIQAKRAELSEARMKLDEIDIGSVLAVAGAIVAVVGAGVTAGASLAAVPTLIVAAQGVWKEFSYNEDTKVARYRQTDITDWFEWRSLEPKPEIKALAKGLQDIKNQSIDLISTIKALEDINKTKIDDVSARENEYRELIRKTAVLVFERAQIQTRVLQKDILVQASDLKIKQANADLDMIKAELSVLGNNLKQLSAIARLVVARNQEYVDYITKYMFLASRALEIYKLEDLSASMVFDYGYVHPDREADSYSALDRGDNSRLLALMHEYIDSYTRIPGSLSQRDAYQEYQALLESTTQFWNFDDVATLAEFKGTRMLEFSIGLPELLPDRLEAKVSAVHVALPGATAADPLINCMLEHT